MRSDRQPVKVISEFKGIRRDSLGDGVCRALERLDSSHSRHSGFQVFDWGHRTELRAKSWVGVVEVPGLSIEILPKTYQTSSNELGRRNLVFMLREAGAIPSAPRGSAALRSESMPLLEAIVAAFAERLVEELGRGSHRAYQAREENLPVLRGRLLLTRHIALNHGLENRVFAGFDEFSPDTLLNRVLKAACERLIRRMRSARTLHCLEIALLHLAGVESASPVSTEIDRVLLDHPTARFRDVFEFARLVLSGDAHSLSAGAERTFSILFPMHKVFEAFVANTMARNASHLGMGGLSVKVQKGGRALLVEGELERGRFWLHPDILIEAPGGTTERILDTKWKVLLSDTADAKNGVSAADMYQLFAYATRFRCKESILLYPKLAGVTPKSFRDPASGRRLRVEVLDMDRDFATDRAGLLTDLRRVLGFHGESV
jgi:5-methylcytosine-specific restriction enzyme subunit McrC